MKITLLTGKTFELENEFDFPLQINSGWKTRRLTLRIDTKNRKVVLSMPKICSTNKAREFILNHLDWIEEHLSKLPPVKEFTDGEIISVLGRQIRLCHLPDSLKAAAEQDGVLYVGGDLAFFHRRVKDYIKREAKKDFWKRSKALADQLNCPLENVTLKDTKSRWGSCSSLNNINYNWRIALAPQCVIDYLMAHEVSHLKHRDHSPAFWRCVKTLNPGAALGRNWLKAHGSELYLYR